MKEQYEQINLFDLGKKKLEIEQPIRLIELFAGIGSQAMALRDLGADFEHYKVVEFDKYAIKSYNAINKLLLITLQTICLCTTYQKVLQVFLMPLTKLMLIMLYRLHK